MLTNNTFSNRKVLGIDNTKAFIRKDLTKIVGDEALRKQITPIRALGQCLTLAFDTEGSVFSAKTVNKNPDGDTKAIAGVFAKRISLNAKPKPCHFCECEGHNSGTAYMTCMSCEHQGSLSADYVSRFGLNSIKFLFNIFTSIRTLMKRSSEIPKNPMRTKTKKL